MPSHTVNPLAQQMQMATAAIQQFLPALSQAARQAATRMAPTVELVQRFGEMTGRLPTGAPTFAAQTIAAQLYRDLASTLGQFPNQVPALAGMFAEVLRPAAGRITEQRRANLAQEAIERARVAIAQQELELRRQELERQRQLQQLQPLMAVLGLFDDLSRSSPAAAESLLNSMAQFLPEDQAAVLRGIASAVKERSSGPAAALRFAISFAQQYDLGTNQNPNTINRGTLLDRLTEMLNGDIESARLIWETVINMGIRPSTTATTDSVGGRGGLLSYFASVPSPVVPVVAPLPVSDSSKISKTNKPSSKSTRRPAAEQELNSAQRLNAVLRGLMVR